MKIVILGAGAVGGFFGAKMARAGLQVQFYVRERRYHQLRETGLHISSGNGDLAIHPDLITKADEGLQPDLVILAVKAYQLEGTFSALDAWVEKGALVLPLLNGMEPLDQLIERYGANAVLGGLCYIESTLDEEGRIVQRSAMQEIVFGALNKRNEKTAQEIYQTLRICDFDVKVSDDIKRDMWEKYMFLTILSGMTSTTRKPLGDILADKAAFSFMQDMLGELADLAAAEGIVFSEDVVAKIMGRYAKAPASMTSSMYRDLVKGLPLELDNLQGYAVRHGAKYGISTACLRSVYALLHPQHVDHKSHPSRGI